MDSLYKGDFACKAVPDAGFAMRGNLFGGLTAARFTLEALAGTGAFGGFPPTHRATGRARINSLALMEREFTTRRTTTALCHFLPLWLPQLKFSC
jgi:hypothetical protein